MKTLLSLTLLVALTLSARATETVNLDAGELAVNADTNMDTGSLLLLIATSSTAPDNIFSESLTAGQYVAGDDYILGAAAFDTNNGTNETGNTIINLTGVTGDDVALRWFPDITYAQYLLGVMPSAGNSFGTYFPGIISGTMTGGNPDGGDDWVVPSAGSDIDLEFYTSNSDGGGTQLPIEGYANYVVAGGASVPEPSTCLFLGLGLLFFPILRRRFGSRQSQRLHQITLPT